MTMNTRTIQVAQWRQAGLITVTALAVFLGLRTLPIGTNLNHMDFRVAPGSTNAIEFCDPLNPQFIPVVAVRSPVVMEIRTTGPVPAGVPARVVATFKTASGKPLAPEDLLITHTRRMHLLIVDPTLRDYQHVHPTPGRAPGEWVFEFTPRFGGLYRVFADFTPAATGRGLYASADLAVGAPDAADGSQPLSRQDEILAVEREGVRYSLAPAADSLRAGEPADLRFSMSRRDGGEVRLEPVMDAFAHLVAFDEARSGFAHLHPTEGDVSKAPVPSNPVLNFKLTIPRSGRYVIWAQINLAGTEQFIPFWFNVRD